VTGNIVRSVRLLAPAEVGTPDVEVVVPVYNEQATLEQSVRRLHAFLVADFPFSFNIVIADNASTDASPAIAGWLAEELAEVEVLRLERKGRGHALRAAWSRSSARVVTYMDVDLSTDLRALLPLVAPLLSGHSDVAIGTRLARGARVLRGPKREFISRAYNRMLRTVLRARFTDAQCGFKAVSARALPGLLDEVRDDGWFFDTELLILAQRQGKRIHEVPVDWVDDPESSVALVKTAVDDLRGVGRLLAASHLTRFAAIGILSTFAHALLFLILSGFLAPETANALALAITAVGNTAANRRITFGVRGREGLLRHQLQGVGVFALALAMTSGALGLLHVLVDEPARAVDVGVLIAANLCATVTRYLVLRRVFGQRRRNRLTASSQLTTAEHPAKETILIP
jgi:glycosyltransferase involved in cell wall biosynthesis